MREIKFRAWDGDRMYEWDSLACASMSVHELFCSGRFVEIMQYTGLKDKNGKEIYEGDIVISKVEDCENCKPEYNCNTCPQVENMRDVVTLNIFRYWLKNESFGYEGENLISPENCEVIGNIYENPELKDPV